MSAFHHYSLLCDEPDCSAEFNAGHVTVADTRDAAIKQGWSYVLIPPDREHSMARYRDFCPAHRKSS